jgi:uncharacterized protein YgiM (DUF1202 family)
MKAVRFTLILLLSLAALAQAEQTTVLHHVYLRSDPSTSKGPVATLRKGQKVMLVEPASTDGFFHVRPRKAK